MDWQDAKDSLYKKFEYKDFKEAFEFIKQVAQLAEDQNHHPRIINEYNIVEIFLTSHDAGGVTEKDHTLARAIDDL